MRAMPPITPPTMAPMGVDFFFEFEIIGGLVTVGVVLSDADGFERVGVAEGVTVTVFSGSSREELGPLTTTAEEVPVGRRVAVKA